MGSEDVKNWVSALSIVVGGLWVLYQWNTLFPKTAAEVAVSAASATAKPVPTRRNRVVVQEDFMDKGPEQRK